MSNSTPSITCSTLVELLRWRAQEQADQLAYTFLVDGESQTESFTYAELDQHARVIAARLQQMPVEGARALLLYPPGREFIAAFFGCLYAGVIAIPVYPPDPANFDRTLPKLVAITRDAQPIAVLTNAMILSMADTIAAQVPEFRSAQWIATDRLPNAGAADWRMPTITERTLAFLQYTSGSTASPKGVMVSHGNLLHNEAQIQHAMELDERCVLAGWLPLYHDMGLIGNVLQPFFTGFPAVLMSPMSFLQKPIRWLRMISHYRATISGGPNFAYQLCVRKITPEQRATLDLSSWRLAFNGAEPVRAHTLEQFASTFAPCGFRREAFYPCYGLAEATLFVTGGAISAAPVIRHIQAAPLEQGQVVVNPDPDAETHAQVGCGHTYLGQTIAIVHPDTCTRCSDDQVGEIWIAGPSVTQGYWGRAETTMRTFRAHLIDTEEGPFLRTGDLGFVTDGELFVTGRIKDLIIINGRNHYPQDIEMAVERCHSAIRPGCCAAFTVERDGQERLVIAAEIDRRYRPGVDRAPNGSNSDNARLTDEIVQSIRRAVKEQHDLQVYSVALLRAGSIPKTSSGKLQRFACRAGFLAETLERWE